MKKKELFPVTKNGKFFGYADEDQIQKNKSLEIYYPAQPKKEEKEQPSLGAGPEQIKRRPGRPKRNS